ncbi:MAG: GcrA family cell cycle regulator [Roseibium album]|uniref:GcrA family cell cycle regulator n=1 Tax=Roseibium album TaxID=311410 RepID=UPI0032EB54C2
MITRQWSELSSMEKAEVCRPFAAEGLSGAEMALRISAMYGRVSRNAVIGACNRNGIFLGNPVRGRRAKAPSAKPESRGKAPANGACKTAKAARKTYPQRESLAAAAGMSREERAELNASSTRPGGQVAFAELGARSCRWPVWGFDETTEKGGFYCGAACAADAAYCPAHSRLAYAAPVLVVSEEKAA